MTALLALDEASCRYGDRLAVEHTTIALQPGESLGLVGESGSGKTTILRMMLRLAPVSDGSLRFDGTDITVAKGAALAPLRRAVQVVFQNPHAALDPRYTVHAAVAEPLRLLGQRQGLTERVAALLDDVGLPTDYLWRYPHELSGGQKQRVCIARALAPQPRALLLDEPTSALDVSVQAQIIDLLATLRRRHRLTYLFVSHNLAVVRLLCDRVAVMQSGQLVEQGPAATILAAPTHPYTRSLLAAVLPPRATAHTGAH